MKRFREQWGDEEEETDKKSGGEEEQEEFKPGDKVSFNIERSEADTNVKNPGWRSGASVDSKQKGVIKSINGETFTIELESSIDVYGDETKLVQIPKKNIIEKLGENTMKTKKKLNRLEQDALREKNRKKLFETIGKTPARKNMPGLQKGVDLKLLSEAGYKFAVEDKDFLNKTKEELDSENKKIKKLNEQFLGMSTLRPLAGDMYGGRKKANLKESTELTIDAKDAKWLHSLLENKNIKNKDAAKRIREIIAKNL